MEYQNYYDTLGINRSTSAADIQKAYRKLARKYHPDVNKSEQAEDRFKEIAEAYEVLGDAEKRGKYDQYGAAWKRVQGGSAPPPGWEHFDFDFATGQEGFTPGADGFSSFFEMLFGTQGGHQNWNQRWRSPSSATRRAQRSRQRGDDRETRLSLSLEEIVTGGSRRLDLVDPMTGQHKRLEVSIPKGVLPGQKIRLSGQGDPGLDGSRGDLYLIVETRPHQDFELDGRDLRTVLAISPWEAALGQRVRIKTLTGAVDLALPPGSSSGRQIRLKGRGIPSPSGADGDLFVELKIVVPKTLSERERELLEELARDSEFEPRPDSTA